MKRDAIKHSIFIFGEPYSILSDESEASVQRLALEVDELMQDISKKSGNADVKRIAIFAALHLAHKLKKLEGKQAEQEIQESRLIDYINKELASF